MPEVKRISKESLKEKLSKIIDPLIIQVAFYKCTANRFKCEIIINNTKFYFGFEVQNLLFSFYLETETGDCFDMGDHATEQQILTMVIYLLLRDSRIAHLLIEIIEPLIGKTFENIGVLKTC